MSFLVSVLRLIISSLTNNLGPRHSALAHQQPRKETKFAISRPANSCGDPENGHGAFGRFPLQRDPGRRRMQAVSWAVALPESTSEPLHSGNGISDDIFVLPSFQDRKYR